jgi:5,5'-dehydrodivanillate O-demethylase
LVPRDDVTCLFFGIQHVQVAPEELEPYRAMRAKFLADVAAAPPLLESALDVLAGKRRVVEFVDHPLSAHIEDMVAQGGQGPIQDRGNERLGRTDVGVILMRKLWSRELKALAEGQPLTQWRYAGERPEIGA